MDHRYANKVFLSYQNYLNMSSQQDISRYPGVRLNASTYPRHHLDSRIVKGPSMSRGFVFNHLGFTHSHMTRNDYLANFNHIKKSNLKGNCIVFKYTFIEAQQRQVQHYGTNWYQIISYKIKNNYKRFMQLGVDEMQEIG